MDQGETVPARASLGESGTTLEVPEDDGEGKGDVWRKGLGEVQGGVAGIGEVCKIDGVCQ